MTPRSIDLVHVVSSIVIDQNVKGCKIVALPISSVPGFKKGKRKEKEERKEKKVSNM